MRVNVVGYEQHRSVSMGPDGLIAGEELSSMLVLELPDGTRVLAQLEEEGFAAALQALERATVQFGSAPAAHVGDPVLVPSVFAQDYAQPPPVPPGPPPPLPPPPNEPVENAVMVDWRALSDEQLHPSVRAVMENSNLPSALPLPNLLNLVAEISDKLRSTPQRTPLQSVPRSRKVAADEAGNPIVPGARAEDGGPDPGEVNPNADDDGVPQL